MSDNPELDAVMAGIVQRNLRRKPTHVCGWRGIPGLRWMHSGPLRFLCATCRGLYPTLEGHPDNIGPMCAVCYKKGTAYYTENLYRKAMADAGLDPDDDHNWPSR